MIDTYRQAQPDASPSKAGRRRQRMIRRGAALLGLATAAMLAAACGSSAGNTASSGAGGSSGPNGNAAAANAAISARQLSGIGTALVNGSGMTIYTPKMPAEMNGTIRCTGSCLSFWFPVTASPASLHSSGLPGKLGTVHRPGGKAQLTYNGRPLYMYSGDLSAGMTNGDGLNAFGGVWHIARPLGSVASPGPSPTSMPSGY